MAASVLAIFLFFLFSSVSCIQYSYEDVEIRHLPRSISEELDAGERLTCEQKTYKAFIQKRDNQGRKCWDNLLLPACWGRCDSFEVADWHFPFKIQKHPVCNFGSRVQAVARLRNCDDDVTPGTEIFQYQKPTSCVCKSCNRVDTNCGWLSDPTITEKLIAPPN